MDGEHFNSHPHEEDDNVRHSNAHIHQHFNSHPHEEDDVEESRNCRTRKHFNSHPHEEDDAKETAEQYVDGISTHILTKRMTFLQRSRRLSVSYFNSHPHEEDDDRGRFRGGRKVISTHILTKRMTAILNKNNLFKIAYYISNKHFISIVDIFFHFHIYFYA